MQAIQTLIIDILGPFGPLMVIGLVGLFVILLTLPVVFRRKQDPLDRLKAANRPTNKTERLRAASSKDTLEKYSNFLEPQNAAEYSAVKLKLLQS